MPKMISLLLLTDQEGTQKSSAYEITRAVFRVDAGDAPPGRGFRTSRASRLWEKEEQRRAAGYCISGCNFRTPKARRRGGRRKGEAGEI